VFGFFKKRNELSQIDFSSLKVDMHSHILPGIDDGARNVDASLAMARRFTHLGFKKLIATPHVMADYYRNTPDTIHRSLDMLREAFDKSSINLELEAAAEYYLDETFLNKLRRKEILSFGDNYLLFELSYINPPTNLVDVISQILDAGYKPVLAHPERYPYYSGGVEDYLQLKDYGCFLQLNTISLTGYYGTQAKKTAEVLVKNHCVSFLGTDMHHLRHAAALEQSAKLPVVKSLLESGQLNNLLL
jgi:tyrosine-protein phosphatase YwqE